MDQRLKVIQCADIILATLQSAFGQDDLINGTNPYRFVPEDPKNSKVWVCDPEQRLEQRDGARQMVTVFRGEFTPQELHLYNDAGNNFQGTSYTSDLNVVPIYVQCEAGNKLGSEVLASICFNVIKLFRRDLMSEFNIHSLKLLGVGPAAKQKDVPGEPWTTVVTLRLEIQETSVMTEVCNQLNRTKLNIKLPDGTNRVIAALDS